MNTTSTEPPDLHGPRGSLRDEARGMRGTLIFSAALIVVIGIAIVVGLVTDDTGNGAPAGDIQASTVDYQVIIPRTMTTGHHEIGYTNRGKVGHEIVMFQTALPADRLPLTKDGDVNEDAPELKPVADSGDALAPGRSKSFTTFDLKPGHYVAVCNLPGHYKLGMHVDVEVK